MLRRIFALLLVLTLTLGLCGCSIQLQKKTSSQPSEPSKADSRSQPEADSSESVSEPEEEPVYDGSLISMLWGEDGSYTDQYGDTWEYFYAVPQIDSPGAERMNQEIADIFGQFMFSSLENRDDGDSPLCTRIEWKEHWNGSIVTLVLSADFTYGFIRYGVYSFDFKQSRELSTEELLRALGYDLDGLDLALRRAASRYFIEKNGTLYDKNMLSYNNFLRCWMLADSNFTEEAAFVYPEEDGSLTALLSFPVFAGAVDWQYEQIPLLLGQENPGAGKEVSLEGLHARLDADKVSIWLDGKGESRYILDAFGYEPGVEYEIESCYGLYTDIFLGVVGQNFIPYLFLLTEDGRMEYVNVYSGLGYGALVCGGPVYGVENVTGFKAEPVIDEFGGGYQTVYALTADGDQVDMFEYLYEVEQNCLPGGVLGYWETFTSSEDELPEMSILLEQSGVHLEKRVNGAKNTTPFDGYLTCLGPLGDGCCYGYSLQSDNESYSGAFILSVDFGMMAIEPIQPNELFQETLYFGLKS